MSEDSAASSNGDASAFPGVSPDSDPSIEAIGAHIERHVGKIEYVWHEMTSTVVHVDLHVVFPTEERPFYTIVTSGMSDLPMSVPPEMDDWKYAELLMRLPPDWNLEQSALRDERNYWPLRWMKLLSRFPHQERTWLGPGHTVPNGDPPRPFAPDMGLCCMLLTPPYVEGDAFAQCEVRPGKTIQFYSLMPIFESEMRYKLEHGADALEDRFEKAETSLIVDPSRPPAV